MKYAVIYARYSSDRQNEMSIEGQIDKCRSYADEHGLVVVQEYIDRAQSATTDKRPEFLRMISDSEERTFDTILVYQLDRFARNKDDSGYYKKILRDNGVKVVSAMEQISTDSSGVITEGMLEIVADWYSKQLSEKVNRGMRQRAEKAKYNGGGKIFGYIVDQDGYFAPDPETAPIVKEIFQRTSYGEPGTEIVKDLVKRGIKNTNGKPLSKGTLYRILRNEKYKGIYIYDDIRVPDGMPRIVSDALFEEVRAVVEARAYKSGRRPAQEDYLLTGKLYCGHCNTQMSGTSGTSKSGKTHRYYTCKNAPKKCDKTNVKKEYIENKVFSICKSQLTDDQIADIIKSIVELNEQDQDSLELARLKKEIKSLEDKIEKLIDQLEGGMDSVRVATRLKKREEELASLKRQRAIEESKKLKIDPDMARRFLKDIRRGRAEDIEYRKMLIRLLIDKIYLYDDRYIIVMNYTGKRLNSGESERIEIEEYYEPICSEKRLGGAPDGEETNHIIIDESRFILRRKIER